MSSKENSPSGEGDLVDLLERAREHKPTVDEVVEDFKQAYSSDRRMIEGSPVPVVGSFFSSMIHDRVFGLRYAKSLASVMEGHDEGFEFDLEEDLNGDLRV